MAHGESPRHARKPKKAAARKSSARPKKAAARKTSSATEGKTPRVSPAGDGSAGGTAPYEGSIRLQKLLAAAGFGSRREVEQYLTDERVTVNGRVASLGDRADPAVDDIRLDGERLMRDRPAYWILNKPRGILTTVRDDEGRRTVVNLLPPTVGRLFPVGRLDKETSGLLLMTNDGDVAHAFLHPSLGNEREYRVNVKGHIDSKSISRLSRGVSLEEGRMAAARVTDVRYDRDSGNSSLTLTLIEGRKRQIRRSLIVLGFPVRRLVRVRMGPLRLGRLAVGESRPLRAEEKRELLKHVARLRAGGGTKSLASDAGPSSPRPTPRRKPPTPTPERTHKPPAKRAAPSRSRRPVGKRRAADDAPAPRKRAAKRKTSPKKKATGRGKSTAARGKPAASKRGAARKGKSGPARSTKATQRTARSRKGTRK